MGGAADQLMAITRPSHRIGPLPGLFAGNPVPARPILN
jgi:hypothetical protein